MKCKYIVQSNTINLYEEYSKKEEALNCCAEYQDACPYIEEITYKDDYDDYLDDPNYEVKFIHPINDDKLVTELGDLTPIEAEENNEWNWKKVQQDLIGEYINSYRGYCKATYGDNYNIDEALDRDEFKPMGLGHVYRKYGCLPDDLKKYLKQSRENCKSKENVNND